MKIGLSGTEYSEKDGIEGVIRNSIACNARFVELWYPKNTAQLGLKATLDRLKEEKIQVVCVATGSELYRNGGSIADQQLLCEAIRIAAETGAPLVNTYFGYANVLDDAHAIETYAAYLKPCLELAAASGVTICLENEFNAFGSDPVKSDITRRPEALKALFRKVNHPRFKLTFDPANFYCAGVEPYPYAYELLKEHIGYVHVKDVYQLRGEKNTAWHVFPDYENEYQTCPMGEGTVNWDGIFRSLIRDGYQGHLSLEPHSKPELLDESWNQSARYVNARIRNGKPGADAHLGMLHHLKLNISNVEQSLDFYCEKLGMQEMCRYSIENDGLIVQLSFNGQPPGIELWHEQPALPIENEALHFAFEVKDLASTVATLRDKKVPITREPFAIGHERIAFIKDPDGYQIELYHDTNVDYNS